jgi:hypothetical protein
MVNNSTNTTIPQLKSLNTKNDHNIGRDPGLGHV